MIRSLPKGGDKLSPPFNSDCWRQAKGKLCHRQRYFPYYPVHEIRKELTDEWKKYGIEEGPQFAILTDIIYKAWAGKSAKEYKQFKGLKKENLRDNMTNRELVLNMLAEVSTKDISEETDPETFSDHMDVARRGGNVARTAREQLEKELGHSVISPDNAKSLANTDLPELDFEEDE